MANLNETVVDSEFTLRLDLGDVPARGQRESIIAALRKVADALEEYPTAEAGDHRGGRRSFGTLGVAARWVWQA